MAMNARFIISVVVMAITSLLLGFVVHGWLLAPDYLALGGLFRTPEQQQSVFAAMIAAHILIGLGFTWIYLHGREAKPFLPQGVRFGLADRGTDGDPDLPYLFRGPADAGKPRSEADRVRHDRDGDHGDRLRVDQPGPEKVAAF